MRVRGRFQRRQARGEAAVQRPADYFAREGIQHQGQVDELLEEPDVGNVGHPKLVDCGQLHALGQVQVDFRLMVRLGGDGEGLGLDAEQVILAHQPQDPLMVDDHAAAVELGRDPPVTVAHPVDEDLSPGTPVAAAMFKDDLLHGAAHFHFLFAGVTLLKKTIESGAADLGQPAHRLDTKAAVRRHLFPDYFPDAVSPEPVAVRRRASTFSQAAFKKSTSRVLFTSAFLSSVFSRRRRCSAP